MIAKELGGIIMASPPEAKIGPKDSALLYLRFRISGTRLVPNTAVLAIVDPHSMPKRAPDRFARMLSRAGIFPTNSESASILLIARPE